MLIKAALQHNHLMIAADFKLNVSSSNSGLGGDILETSSTNINEVQVQAEQNVSLLCSSGLSDKLSSFHIPVMFRFYPKHGHRADSHIVTATCVDSDDSVSKNNGKWIISRQQSPPHDCVLTIVDLGRHDIGKYRCAGVLSQSESPSQQVEDWSNILHLKLPSKLQPAGGLSLSQLGYWATVVFGVLVACIIAIVLAFVAIVIYSVKHRKTRTPLYQGMCLQDSVYKLIISIHSYIMILWYQCSLDSMEAHLLSTMTFRVRVSCA